MYRAVVFDLFGTLVDMFPFHLAETTGEIAAALGVPAHRFGPAWLASYGRRESGQTAGVRGCLAEVMGEIGFDVSEGRLEAATEAVVAQARRSLVPRPGALGALEELRRMGLRIGMVSGCSPELPPLWPETFLASLVDVSAFTCVEGTRKSDPLLYSAVADRLGVEPEECLYVGDGGAGELSGALAAGMHPVLIRVAHDHEYDFLRPGVDRWRGTTIGDLGGVARLLDEQNRRRIVSLYELGAVPEERLAFVVVACWCAGRLVLVRHKQRSTWEAPGGHVEAGEPVDDAASRELREETGALEFSLSPVCDYSLTHGGRETFARLYHCNVVRLGAQPDSEIGEVRLFDGLPAELTYPDVHPVLLERAAAGER